MTDSQRRRRVSLDVMWLCVCVCVGVCVLTVHNDPVAQLLADTRTGKVSFPPLPFLSLCLSPVSTYSERSRYFTSISLSVGHIKHRHARNDCTTVM